MNFAAFFSYILLTAFTPGPNNIMAMSGASRHGFRKGLRFCFGVFLGFLVIIACCAAFTVLLFRFIPKIEPVMVYVGAAYILWLAWTVYRDKPHSAGGKKPLLESGSLLSGMVLQFVNVKVILYGITAMSTFILPYYQGFAALAGFVLLLSGVGFAATSCWALFGALFEKLLNAHRKPLNLVMSLMLVYCAVSQLFPS